MKEALKLALEALERGFMGPRIIEYQAAITAIKEALAQPEQEPVAYCYVQKGTSVDILTFDDAPDDAVDGTIFPLYTTPPKRPWVGLTDEEAEWCQAPSRKETWKRMETKLKEKNT